MPGLFDDIADWLNSGATVRTRLAKTQGPSGLFHAIANPDAVMNSEPANVGSGFLGPMGAVGLGGVMTYHGTPHKFDKFDLSKIGTGEGAQVYGHGMYFAENPQTAKTYQNTLGGQEARDAAGNVVFTQPRNILNGDTTPQSIAFNALTYAHDTQSSAPYQLAAKTIRDEMRLGNLNEYAVAKRKAALDVLDEWGGKQVKPASGGSLLAQDLPDEMLPKMLQWDAPLKAQPGTHEALKALGARPDIHPAFGVALEAAKSRQFDGQDLYMELLKQYKTAPAVARALSESGIPGLSYLDQGSRAAGKGTMNHVVWDQDLLNRMIPQAIE